MKENNEKKLNSKDKKILIIIIVSILCITLLISTSLAMLISNNSSAKKDIYKTGSLTIVFNDENAQNIILNKAKPITDEYAMATIKTYDFTIENEGSTVATYNISLTNEEITTVDNISNEYVKSKIKYQINDRDPQILSEAKGNVLLSGGINPGKTKEFKLRVWLSIDADNKVQNSTYKAQVSISGKAVHYYYDSVAETILSNETPITKTPTFTKGSQDRGLFLLEHIKL